MRRRRRQAKREDKLVCWLYRIFSPPGNPDALFSARQFKTPLYPWPPGVWQNEDGDFRFASDHPQCEDYSIPIKVGDWIVTGAGGLPFLVAMEALERRFRRIPCTAHRPSEAKKRIGQLPLAA